MPTASSGRRWSRRGGTSATCASSASSTPTRPLHFPDYRSGELTFSLLTQVAGRAGRGDEPAQVVLQTYSPEHYAVRHATTHDYLGFARDEIRVRKALHFPPYARLCVCTFTHRDDAEAEIEARREAQRAV